MPSFNEQLILTGAVDLDKDKSQQGIHSKVYSKETCAFLSCAENRSLTEHFTRNIIMIDSECNATEYHSIAECVQVNRLTLGSVAKCLAGKRKTHKGCTFKYKDSTAA